MRTTKSTSSLPSDEDLLSLPLKKLLPHPANANVMPEERLEKLAHNIEREGRYPPIIVRPHPDVPGNYQVLDGHQRLDVLRRLGHRRAICFLWPCDDVTALVLLTTLNRLEGEDVPAKRSQLLAELTALMPASELARLLPESEDAINDALNLMQFDTDALLADLSAAAERSSDSAPRLISFVVLPEDEAVIESVIASMIGGMDGANRRGRALGAICRRQLEAGDA